MCDPVSLGVGVLGAVAATSMMPKVPNMPAPTAPTAPPTPTEQTAKAPDIQAARKANAGAGATTGPNASAASTLLTGPEGVDPNKLELDRKVLLGL